MLENSPYITWDPFHSAVTVIENVIARSRELSAMSPMLPEDGSTMQAFLMRKERRYIQMGMGTSNWGNAPIDRLVGPALTYWMYLQRTIDLSDWATAQRRLLECFDKTMSQSQLLTELAIVRWNGNTKEYTDQFAAVAEREVGVAPDELADSYCAGLPTDHHLLIRNNGLVKYTSWEQAATAAARLYESMQTVLELREGANQAIRAATEATETQRKQKNGTRPGENTGSCYERQGRGHPARVCPSKEERTKRPGETCKKCGGLEHYARDCPTHHRGRAEPENKSSVVGDERSRPRSHGKGMMCPVATGPNAIPVSLERGNRLLKTVEKNKMSDEVVQGTQPVGVWPGAAAERGGSEREDG
ncbi:hypothetical protein, conserved [Eimeria tenella]|uniref:CCHC-type domain-containing protein n=1 Tax=Eimeria tenella TaxID=5802 RepID=U6KWF1_EIMTE|nr:hypothetical protein, conserved [Eimeria tenella]CDJ42301.1 hypothetical protein, conserved [Eimeria tenella]|eukprot:XP_013233051.1 hypothetical protein, conserved [Eimeria tenella]